MKLVSILANEFKLDGGAMFGLVPKSLWNKAHITDGNNHVDLAARCLLIDDGVRRILIDTGIGNKMEEKLAKHYHINPNISLSKSLYEAGYDKGDITDVFLSHLHLDHAGGAVILNANGELTYTFPNATYWSNKTQWAWATINPNLREVASFRKENLQPLQDGGRLRFVEDDPNAFPNYFNILYAHGHTKGMMMPRIAYKKTQILFTADLLPSVYHIPLLYIPAYDATPLQSLAEKKAIFRRVIDEDWVLFLNHDIDYACCTLAENEKEIYLKSTHTLDEIR